MNIEKVGSVGGYNIVVRLGIEQSQHSISNCRFMKRGRWEKNKPGVLLQEGVLPLSNGGVISCVFYGMFEAACTVLSVCCVLLVSSSRAWYKESILFHGCAKLLF